MSKQILVLNSIRGKSGKDTLISLLESKGYRVHRVAFADILKKRCASELAFSSAQADEFEAMMHRSAKDDQYGFLAIGNIPSSPYATWLEYVAKEDLYTPRSLRWHLQKFGTEYTREFLKSPDEWLNLGLKEIHEGIDKSDVNIVVVTDCRLPNELKALEDLRMVYQTVSTVRIVRDWFISGVDDQPYHISDIALMASHFDHLVVNKLGEPWGMLDQLTGVV
ncbi:hypothetical protein FW800_25775 [Pseudomonas sp. 910_23]|uniref:hypothetical protein n=1 Tax=Pseudomonas sp. 910_23 TaxID=2604461 RepID=UPI0040646E9A